VSESNFARTAEVCVRERERGRERACICVCILENRPIVLMKI
jgi:hypothetical protein